MHNSKNSFFHFTCILGSQYNHQIIFQIYLNCCFRANILNRQRCFVFTSIKYMEIDLFIIRKISLQFFRGRSNEHILHEKSMVGSTANNSNFKLIFRIPTSISVNNIQLFLFFFYILK